MHDQSTLTEGEGDREIEERQTDRQTDRET